MHRMTIKPIQHMPIKRITLTRILIVEKFHRKFIKIIAIMPWTHLNLFPL